MIEFNKEVELSDRIIHIHSELGRWIVEEYDFFGGTWIMTLDVGLKRIAKYGGEELRSKVQKEIDKFKSISS